MSFIPQTVGALRLNILPRCIYITAITLRTLVYTASMSNGGFLYVIRRSES
jgi:hypothetical protein